MNKYPNRKSPRLKGYDYSSSGYYFVTIVTQDRVHRFGTIRDAEMHLNDAGKMVLSVWNCLPERFPMISLDAFQIMPNHIHGIIIIGNAGERDTLPVRTIESGHAGVSIRQLDESKKKRMGDVVGAFKSIITTRYIKGVKLGLLPPFHKRLLQNRCYDHIVRDENELFRIRQYIINNPANWQKDKMKNPDKNGVREISVLYGEEPWMI